MWETIEMIIQPIAVYLVMPLLLLGWAVCLFEPGWSLITLWRSSRLPLLPVEREPATVTAHGTAAQREALSNAIPLLLAAEGTAENLGAVAPRGLRDFLFLPFYAGVFFIGIACYITASVLSGFPMVWEELTVSLNLVGVVLMLAPFAGVPTGFFGMVQLVPGLNDAEDSLIEPLAAQRYFLEAQNILLASGIEINGDVDIELDPFVDPAQPTYHNNKGMWMAMAFLPRILLHASRVMTLRPQATKLLTTARDLRMAAEEAYEKLEAQAAPSRQPLAERIPV